LIKSYRSDLLSLYKEWIRAVVFDFILSVLPKTLYTLSSLSQYEVGQVSMRSCFE